MKVNVGFLGLLGLLFIGLKLGSVIDWPWLWVLAPLWGPLAIWLGFIAICGLIAGLCAILVAALDKKR